MIKTILAMKKYKVKNWKDHQHYKNKTVGGLVHDLEKLSFMLRISKADTKMYLEKFESKGWLVECKQDASKML